MPARGPAAFIFRNSYLRPSRAAGAWLCERSDPASSRSTKRPSGHSSSSRRSAAPMTSVGCSRSAVDAASSRPTAVSFDEAPSADEQPAAAKALAATDSAAPASAASALGASHGVSLTDPCRYEM